MNVDEDSMRFQTRHLEPAVYAHPTQMLAKTGPLDNSLPWVIEFRAVGTPITLQVQVKDRMILGRADAVTGFTPEVDLTPCDAFGKGVSRKHSTIVMRDDKLMLQDLYSTNGTRINEVVCAPPTEYRLRHGDEISLGRLRLQVFFAVIPAHTQPVPPIILETNPLNGLGKHVLVVQDDKDVGNVFRLAMDMQGYRVTVVENATHALNTLSSTTIDAIVMDLMLPDMDGFDLVRFLRRQPTTTKIPVLVVSGATAGYQMGKALEAGADIFLGKPVAVEELMRAVKAMIAHSATARA